MFFQGSPQQSRNYLASQWWRYLGYKNFFMLTKDSLNNFNLQLEKKTINFPLSLFENENSIPKSSHYLVLLTNQEIKISINDEGFSLQGELQQASWVGDHWELKIKIENLDFYFKSHNKNLNFHSMLFSILSFSLAKNSLKVLE
jgi:hypothetical protein